MAWALSDIRARWRTHTGRSSVDDITDVNVNSRINDFMQMHLPFEVSLGSMESDWTQETSAVDNGDYSIAETDLDLNEPITANGDALNVIQDKVAFFTKYPVNQDEGFITAPTLAIGSTASNVANAAFKYLISGWTYPKAAVAAGTALSGSTVPQNKYGAWLVEIDSAGTITITGATDNATGYATAALAVNGLPSGSGTKIVMGYVTAINTAGTFIPGTTLLSAATVTDTYTDGNPDLRSAPADVCIAGGKLYVRPKPDDIYLIRAHLSLSRPTSLSGDTITPVDSVLGAFIAIGSAVEYLAELGEYERVQELTGEDKIPGTYLYLKKIVNRKLYKQQIERRSEPSC